MKEEVPPALAPFVTVQDHAKAVMADLVDFIRPGATEAEIFHKARDLFIARGVAQFWYYDIAALVFVGTRNGLSVSGRDYQPTTERVQENDLVGIDLSPELAGAWGDYARSVFVQDGTARLQPLESNPEFCAGVVMQERLHRELITMAKPELTAHELWARMNELMRAHGFENLDFKGNLGHTIEKQLKERSYLDESNMRTLGEMKLFTFEPHIRARDGNGLGYRREDIYYFAGDQLRAL